MRIWNLFILVGLCVALVPAVALAGNGSTGACWVATNLSGTAPAGGFHVAGCTEELDEQECDSIDELTNFSPGATCADIADEGGITWDGSCDASIDPAGDFCVELWTAKGGAGSEAICGDLGGGGGGFSAGVSCQGAPVPTMPGLGLAAMAFLILAGALIILTLKGSLASA